MNHIASYNTVEIDTHSSYMWYLLAGIVALVYAPPQSARKATCVSLSRRRGEAVCQPLLGPGLLFVTRGRCKGVKQGVISADHKVLNKVLRCVCESSGLFGKRAIDTYTHTARESARAL